MASSSRAWEAGGSGLGLLGRQRSGPRCPGASLELRRGRACTARAALRPRVLGPGIAGAGGGQSHLRRGWACGGWCGGAAVAEGGKTPSPAIWGVVPTGPLTSGQPDSWVTRKLRPREAWSSPPLAVLSPVAAGPVATTGPDPRPLPPQWHLILGGAVLLTALRPAAPGPAPSQQEA